MQFVVGTDGTQRFCAGSVKNVTKTNKQFELFQHSFPSTSAKSYLDLIRLSIRAADNVGLSNIIRFPW